jgi:hypothetical protein
MRMTPPITLTLDATNVTASTYNEWLTGTTYSIGDNVKVTFESDGTTPRVPHYEFEALTAGSGKYPHDNPTDWLKLGATNQYKMLDDRTSSQTTRTDNIAVTLGNVNKCDTIGLFRLDAQEVRIVVKDSTPTTIYDETHTLISQGSTSWSEYFFSDIVYRDALILTIPALYLNMTIELTITAGAGLDAKCGHVAVGKYIYLGCTEYGAETGIQDYSVKQTDDFGETYLLERTYAKLVSGQVFVEPGAYDGVNDILISNRATPCIYDFNNDTTSLASFSIFGFSRRFRPIYESHGKTVCLLEIEDLA